MKKANIQANTHTHTRNIGIRLSTMQPVQTEMKKPYDLIMVSTMAAATAGSVYSA